MYRTSNAFSVLQAIAATVALAITFWSLGLPSFHFVEAANITTVSDTLTTSEPSVVADHTIVFTTPTGVANGSTVTINFTGFTGTSSITAADITVATTSGASSVVAASCAGGVDVGAAFGANDDILTLTFCAVENDYIAANGTTTITIGGTNQLVNPAAPGSYEINITAGASDSGATRVAIVSTVLVTASVDTIFNFTVAGVGTGQTVNGTTTGGATDATNIPFGELTSGSASTAAQDLTVQTNAKNGFVVTVVSDGQLDSTVGDIDGFRNGNYDATPQAWEAPSGLVSDENTWGHWGITSDDTDYFAAQQTYVSASTTPVTIFSHDGPVDGVASPSTGTSTTRVGYTVQISSLQEAATDYQAVLTYIATPTF